GEISEIIAKYAPISLGADLSDFTNNEKVAVEKLVAAGRIIDRIYLRQKWKRNESLLEQLLSATPRDENAILFFKLMKGPWDRVDGYTLPYPPNIPKHKPLGGNFYPEDMTKDEFNHWLKKLSPKEQKDANGFYHVIKRNEDTGELYSNPYSIEYKDLLCDVSILLKESSRLVDDDSLSKFLKSRADAFSSNNYFESEVDWLNISKESKIEVTVGPYEVYTDELFSAKSAFNFYIHARDFPFSKTLEKFSNSLQYVENHLPVPDEYKNKKLKATPIVVVNQLYASGDVAVPMTAAYNLPNDEEVKRIGSKLVIIKNVQEGKYQKILVPIAHLTIGHDQIQHLCFDAFFTHILLHEVAHSNGPHYTIGPNPETVRSRLQEFYSVIEEAKADITGLFAAELLLKKGLLTAPSLEQFYVTYLASAFRSIRFGINEAHGLGQCIQINYILEQGGFEYDEKSKRFSVNFVKVSQAVSNLTREILIMQGDGDKSRVALFISKYGKISEQVNCALESLGN
ncbi:6044_t:CDS:2, partial [Funneliformis caledonium]